MKIKNLTFSNLIFAGISVSTIFILIYNILHFNPILGYDAVAHFDYINYFSRYLPRDFRLPPQGETREFFNPPLGYIIPSFAQVLCRNIIDSSNYLISNLAGQHQRLSKTDFDLLTQSKHAEISMDSLNSLEAKHFISRLEEAEMREGIIASKYAFRIQNSLVRPALFMVVLTH